MSDARKSGTRFSVRHRDRKAGDFWSRRKAAVEAEQAEDLRAEEAAALAEREAEQAEKTDAEILQDLGLPDPDTLSEGDDFKAFLTETVPARIRQRALRKLWLTNPILANVDGLVDYGEDFTDASMVVENMQTTYQVGKGMARHLEEMARQAEADALAEAEQQNSADDDQAAPESTDAPFDPIEASDEPVVIAAAEAAPAPPQPAFDDTHETEDAPRRRMRFAFDDAEAEA